MSTKFRPCMDELLESYVAWSVISQYLPEYDVWTLTNTCKTLHLWLHKEHPKNTLAIERSKSDCRCCRCNLWPARRHPMYTGSPYVCATCVESCFDFCMISARTAFRLWGYRKENIRQIKRSCHDPVEFYRLYLVSDILALPESARVKHRHKSERQVREDALRQELRKIGLEMPVFDILCEVYLSPDIYHYDVCNKIDDEIALYMVVQAMAERKMLHEYWDYDKIRRDIIAQDRRRLWGPKALEFEIEQRALARYGPYPKTWPWLGNN